MFQIAILNFFTLGDFEEKLVFCQTPYFEIWHTYCLTLNKYFPCGDNHQNIVIIRVGHWESEYNIG